MRSASLRTQQLRTTCFQCWFWHFSTLYLSDIHAMIHIISSDCLEGILSTTIRHITCPQRRPHTGQDIRARLFSEQREEKVHFTAVPLSARENRLHPFVLRCPPDSSSAWYTCPPTLSACIIQHRYSSACHRCCRLKLRASMCRNQSRPVSSLSRCDILQFLHDSFGETRRRRRGWL